MARERHDSPEATAVDVYPGYMTGGHRSFRGHGELAMREVVAYSMNYATGLRNQDNSLVVIHNAV